LHCLWIAPLLLLPFFTPHCAFIEGYYLGYLVRP
jgi:hypothetical protein